jgi:hypothetical protein
LERKLPLHREADLLPLHHAKDNDMNWQTPSYEEIDMSAEIGSYQGEDDNGL